MASEIYTALGLMSGTSLDGIDAALIQTDGEKIIAFGPSYSLQYDDPFRASLRSAVSAAQARATPSVIPFIRNDSEIRAVEDELTRRHAQAVKALLAKTDRKVDLIGFHGQTLLHRPNEGLTVQVGNGPLLAMLTGIDVVCDFRSNDVKQGGQGAPLVPLYHAALAQVLPKPVAILNIGGIANVTWLGENGEVIAFDTGPGNALLNDFVHHHTGEECDRDGKYALIGEVNEAMLATWLHHPFFVAPAPKSLDRNQFDVSAVRALSLQDGAATLTEFTTAAIHVGAELLGAHAATWYVCGGGRHNPAMMQSLAQRLGDVHNGDALGWEGDALEAQAFAFLAVRSKLGLPLSLPTTTGVSRAVTGGVFCPA